VSDADSYAASRAVEPVWYEAPWPEWGPHRPSPYQQAAVEYRISRRHCLIGDAPGLGKTAESILYGNAIGAERTLVVCPASLRLNWAREIKMWSTTEGATVYPVLKSKDGVSLEHDFVVISYDLLRNDGIMDAILDARWDHVVLDEAHALKDPKGNKRTRAICAPDMLPCVSDRFTLLSGTILPNQPIECYNAVRLMDWDAIDRMSLDTFRDYYYEEGEGVVRGPVLVTKDRYGMPCEPHYESRVHFSNSVRNVPVNMEDLQWRLRSRVMVRRLKEDVLQQLPPKRWHLVPLETTPAVRRALESRGWKEAERLWELDPDAFDRSVPVDGAISTAMRQLGEACAPMVADYVEELLKEGVHKLLLSAWHRNTLDGEGVAKTGLSVLQYLRERLSGYGLVYMDGGTSPRAKQEAVDKFQQDPGCRIILGQLATIGEGWTLTAAQDAVLAEFYWVPGKNDQLLDRLHRIGQEGEYVLGHVPVVPGTLHERVIGTAVWKDRNIHAALDAHARR